MKDTFPLFLKLQVVFLLLPLLSLGQKFEFGDQVTISKPVNEDVYIAGGTININAPINGDLVVAGGMININDSISNDLTIAGGEVVVNGHIGDDLRCAGGKITINKNTGGDLVITGGQVYQNRSSIIGGGLSLSGGNVTIDGIVRGDVRAFAGTMTLNGVLQKSLEVKGGKLSINGSVNGPSQLAAENMTIGPSAIFNDDVRYWSRNKDVNFGNSVKRGKAVFDQSIGFKKSSGLYLGFASLLTLLWYLTAAFILIVILQFLFAKSFYKAASTLPKNASRSIAYGFLLFVLVPAAIIVTMLTLVGIPVAILLALFFATIIILANIITSLVIANYINYRYYQTQKNWRQIWSALGIFIILKLISLVPFLGWLFVIIAIFLAFGAIITSLKDGRTIQINRGATV